MERRQLEGDRAIALARRDAIKADPDRRQVARLGRVDGGPDDLLGLAFEQPFGQDGGLAARPFGPAGRISALSALKGRVLRDLVSLLPVSQ